MFRIAGSRRISGGMPSVPLAFPDFSCLAAMAISANENSPVGISSSVFETAKKATVLETSLIVADHVFFQVFDMSIRSGDIRDQSRKLSEIAPIFGRKN